MHFNCTADEHTAAIGMATRVWKRVAGAVCMMKKCDAVANNASPLPICLEH